MAKKLNAAKVYQENKALQSKVHSLTSKLDYLAGINANLQEQLASRDQNALDELVIKLAHERDILREENYELKLKLIRRGDR